MLTIAMIAHDTKKPDIVALAQRNRERLAHASIIATGHTGQALYEATGLPVELLLSGPYGGDAQIAARVATGDVAVVIFLVDPLYAHPHEPDIQSLLRVCNVHNVPLATNVASAELILRCLG